ncbi:MAG: hypothetical protein IT318_26490 [Anaerolineales bacterium]|nr:hypothetical protein [Anaerolineales bacterium]
MEPLGINFGLLVRLLFGLAPLLLWLLLTLLALFALRGRGLAGTTLAIWVLVIVAAPFLGALAVWIVRPRDQPPAVRT